MQIAECIKKGSKNCKNEKHYDVLTGTTEFLEYSAENGWVRNSFLTYGLDAETSSSRKRRSIGRARR